MANHHHHHHKRSTQITPGGCILAVLGILTVLTLLAVALVFLAVCGPYLIAAVFLAWAGFVVFSALTGGLFDRKG